MHPPAGVSLGLFWARPLGYSLGVVPEPIEIILYAVGLIGAISVVVAVVTYIIAAIMDRLRRK